MLVVRFSRDCAEQAPPLNLWPNSSTSDTNRRGNLRGRGELVVVCAPDAEQCKPVADRPGGRLLRRGADDLHGPAKLDRKIARDGADTVRIEIHRTLPPVLEKLRDDGYRLVGLEQTTNSQKSAQYSVRAPHGAGDRQRAQRLDGRHSGAARRRGGDSRVGFAVQLQRRDGDDDGAVRILPAVSGRMSD